MSMLDYSEITVRKYIILEGEPYEVIDNHIFRMQQRKPQNKTKLRNLISGSMKEMTFHQAEKVEEAEIEKQSMKYLYTNKGEWWFCEENNPSKRFQLAETLLGTAGKFLKPNTVVEALMFGERAIGIKAPAKVELKVTEAPPAVKGDTAKGGNKLITLETGVKVTAPLFVSEGDVVRINTETGEYIERVN
jgi:elongation factor P